MYLRTKNKEECCGCGACVAVCPNKCVTLSQDEYSFVYPTINIESCSECGLCQTVCPFGYERENLPISKNVFIAISKSESIVYSSASGGVFSAICEELIKDGWIIFGCKLSNLQAIHDFSETINGCGSFRKSKYIQSNVSNVFQLIKQMLNNGRKVVFSGTPCQNHALLSFLGVKKHSNLLLIDFLCHGHPSQTMFNDYVNELETRDGKKVENYIFRNKDLIKGKYNSRSAKIIYDDGSSKVVTSKSDEFLYGYYARLTQRPICGVCPLGVRT